MASTAHHKKRKSRKKLKRFLKIVKATAKKLWELTCSGAAYAWSITKPLLQRFVTWVLRQPKKVLLAGLGGGAALIIVLLVVAITAGRGSVEQELSAEQDNAIYFYSPSDNAADGIGGDTAGMTDEEIIRHNEQLDDPADTTGVGNAAEASAQAVYLEKGKTDDKVVEVQTRLMELGYMDDDEPTDYYGKLTAAAVKAFQRHNDLKDDGVCGQSTYDLLLSSEAKPYVMQLGDKGDDVEGAQERLYELGYLTSKSSIDGSFGSSMEAAMKEFQSRNKLASDGKAGNKTLNALYSDKAVSKLYRIGEQSETIKTIQEKLIKLGYFTGKATGEYTKATASAIRSFQADNGLVVDGNVGPATKDAILSNKAQSKVVKLGDKGSDVEAIQKRLIALKYMKSGADTGYYGATTEAAVRAFQKRNGLSQDGVVGTTTLKKLNASNAKKAAPSATPTPKPSKATPKPSSGSSTKATPKPSSGSTSNANESKVDKLISIAKTKLGCPYVRGGKGPNKFDCSGFVYWCLNQAGVKQSYMTSITWRSCSKYKKITSLSGIQKGDVLVFSGSTNDQGHVGIAISSGQMIDASSSQGKVRTTQVTSNYWKQHFICAYRIF